MFHLWWHNGLGNGNRKTSVGLGGNIAISIEEFKDNPESEYVEKGNMNNNGNGSLMRLGPVPIVFVNDIKEGMKIAGNQSQTTHNGLEAQ